MNHDLLQQTSSLIIKKYKTKQYVLNLKLGTLVLF